MMYFRIYGVRQNFYAFNFYRNTNLDDKIFDSSLSSMAAVKAEDVRVSFLCVDDLNVHHQEWLGSPTTSIMVLQPLTSQLCLVMISWLARPMHVVEHLTS